MLSKWKIQQWRNFSVGGKRKNDLERGPEKRREELRQR